MDIRDVAPKSKNLEQPDNNGNDNDGVQNGLYGSGHRYIAVDQPKQNSDYDQDYDDLN